MAPVSVAVRAENVVGKEVPRLDAEAKVKGQARYAEDLAFPGMRYGKAIGSERPHARIRRLDVSRGLAHPQVACVVTAKDIPGRNCIPIIYEDMPLLAEEVVRYVGEPIALWPRKPGRMPKRRQNSPRSSTRTFPPFSTPGSD